MVLPWKATLGRLAGQYLIQEGAGEILGVFGASLYCRVAGMGVLLFHPSRYGVIPFGVSCRDMELLLETLKPLPGMVFSYHSLELYLPATGVRLVLEAENHGAGVAEPVISPSASTSVSEPQFLSPEAISRNLSVAEAMLNTQKPGLSAGIEGLLASVSGNRVHTQYSGIMRLWMVNPMDLLSRGMETGEGNLISAALRRMVGLGTGLTPTMDDVLMGLAYLTAFIRRKRGWILPAAELFLIQLSEQSCRRTTEISGAYLESSARGEVFSLLEEVVIRLLMENDENGLREHVSALLAVGSDSGGNMLAGILLGIVCHCNSIKMI